MADDFLLLEDGFHLVLEDGSGDLLLESSTETEEETPATKLVLPVFEDDGGVERRRRKRKAEASALERMAQLPREEFPAAEPPPEIVTVPSGVAAPRPRKPVDSKLATAIAGKLKPVEIVAAKVETMQFEQQERMAQIQKRRQQEKEDEDALFRLGVFD